MNLRMLKALPEKVSRVVTKIKDVIPRPEAKKAREISLAEVLRRNPNTWFKGYADPSFPPFYSNIVYKKIGLGGKAIPGKLIPYCIDPQINAMTEWALGYVIDVSHLQWSRTKNVLIEEQREEMRKIAEWLAQRYGVR